MCTGGQAKQKVGSAREVALQEARAAAARAQAALERIKERALPVRLLVILKSFRKHAEP